MSLPIDPQTLSGPVQKLLDPAGPAPLRTMAARGLAPGLKPGEALTLVVLLAQGSDALAETAGKTLAAIPAPLLNGALGGPLPAGILHVVAPLYAKDNAISERLLNHPDLHVATVAAMAEVATEAVCELIAINEERLLANPEIIEKLYLNPHARMSTADRILELAVRNGLELKIPAFAQAKAAIEGELISEPTDAPSFDDEQFAHATNIAVEVQLGDKDPFAVDESTGEEAVVEEARPLHAIWTDLRAPAKIRLITVANLNGERYNHKALRELGIRDANPNVAVAALDTPGISDSEIEKFSKMRNVCKEVLGEIARSKEWTRSHSVKVALVGNPRTPFGHAAKFILHLREDELKKLIKSKDVPGAVQTAARQQLARKGKK